MRLRLTVMQFGQFFIWGCWLVTIGAYGISTLHLTGAQVGTIFTAAGVVGLFAPGLVGWIGDTRIDQVKLYAGLQAVAALALLAAAAADNYAGLFWAMLINAIAYGPTIGLGYAICYSILRGTGQDPVQAFPRIRVWGTVGFIVAMWTVSLADWELSHLQFVAGGIGGLLLAGYALTLPRVPPGFHRQSSSLRSALGFDTFRFFGNRRLATFLVFALLLGTLLSISTSWTDEYLHTFAADPIYATTFGVRHPAILISLSQMSEIVFILLIPFFLGRFGIRIVLILSLSAWVIRFALLGLGNPGPGLWMLLLAMIVYGTAFDFFNVAGSLYVETEVSPESRASAQGTFMMMVNGWGAVIGGIGAGWLLDWVTNGETGDWREFWMACSIYAAIILVAFLLTFRSGPDRGAGAEPATSSGPEQA